MTAEAVFALHRKWKDARWRYEVLCRIMDAEMDLWQVGRDGHPESHTGRLEQAREELRQCCNNFTTALRQAKPWDGVERRKSAPGTM